MTVRQATYDEIPDILVVLEAARGIMRASGNARQWVDGYPGEQVIRADLAAGAGYVLLDSAVPGGNYGLGGNYVPGGNHVPGGNYVLGGNYVPGSNHVSGGNYVPGGNYAPGGNCVPGGPDTPSNASNGSDTSSAPMGGHSTHTASSATLPGSVSSRFGRFLRPLWAALRIFLPEVSKKRLDLGQGIGPSRTQKPLSAPEVPPQNDDLGHLPTPSPSTASSPKAAPVESAEASAATAEAAEKVASPDAVTIRAALATRTVDAAETITDACTILSASSETIVPSAPDAYAEGSAATAVKTLGSSAAAETIATEAVTTPATAAERIVGYFAYIPSPEPTYARIYGGAWLDDTLPYHVIHRIASLPSVHGVFAAMLDFCSAAEPNLRIDTHSDNHIMQHLLARHGFTLCGTIYLASGSPRLAYQRLLPTATHPAK